MLGQAQTYYWGDANKDGKIDVDDIAYITDIILGKKPAERIPYENGHEFVDLGLSVKWATCNVGATNPEDFGDYFAWGEITTKDTYNWSTYFDTTDGGSTFNKYNIESGVMTLDLEDDAARANWGGTWRLPTNLELVELIEKCTWTWTTKNGVKGYEVASNVVGYINNSIFFPASGFYDEFGLAFSGDYGSYWSSSLDDSGELRGLFLFFKNGEISGNSHRARYYGQNVRPVCP